MDRRLNSQDSRRHLPQFLGSNGRLIKKCISYLEHTLAIHSAKNCSPIHPCSDSLAMASNTPQAPFLKQFAVRDLGDNTFETITKPQRIGSPLNIAYGGYSLGLACKAAALSVPSGYHLYSMHGNYLGPASTDLQLVAKVKVIRQTRTFATRHVEVGQKLENGEFRVSLIGIADFQVAEEKTLLEYSRTPMNPYLKWQDCPMPAEIQQKLLDDGKVSKELLDMHVKGFSVFSSIFDQRIIPSAIFAQNLSGMAKSLPHSQDHLPIPKRTTADWFRCREPLPSAIDHVTNLAFFIDGAIAFQPLSFNHLWFDDVSATASLDFALRIFQNGERR